MKSAGAMFYVVLVTVFHNGLPGWSQYSSAGTIFSFLNMRRTTAETEVGGLNAHTLKYSFVLAGFFCSYQ